MKTIKRLSVVFALIVATTISSCGGSDEPAVPVPAVSGIPATGTFINAKVDGVVFSTIYAGVTAGSAVRSGNAISLLGVNISSTDLTGTKSISMGLIGITAPGTYPLSNTSESLMGYTDGSVTSTAFTTKNCTGTSGSITITTLNATKIEGTFSFTAKNGGCASTKTITEGQFRGVFN